MLESLRVVEFATYVAGPSAAMIMADWGADVIKVESRRGDPTRRTFAGQPELEGNPVFEVENRGKRSIVLDIGKPAGRDALLRLLKDADVFITNVRPSALKRARLDYDHIKAALPRLIYCSVSGYGLQGPGADIPAFDTAAFWSRGGVGGATTPKGEDPVAIRPGMGDTVCALSTVSATMAAVVERQSTGRGRLVETSLIRAGVYAIGWDMAIQLKWGKLASARPRSRAYNPLANYFKTADERWVGVFPRDGRSEFDHIAQAVDLPDLPSDPRFATGRLMRQNTAELVEALDAGFAKFTLAQVGERLTAVDMVWAPLNAPRDVVDDPLAQAAGCFVDVTDASGATFRAPASPARFPGADDGPKGPAPLLGQHTREVLAQAGYAAAEIDQLIGDEAAA
ncbi:MAG: CaiB/BaiF CoA transferase family protein [Caulobacterales bacterium]